MVTWVVLRIDETNYIPERKKKKGNIVLHQSECVTYQYIHIKKKQVVLLCFIGFVRTQQRL